MGGHIRGRRTVIACALAAAIGGFLALLSLAPAGAVTGKQALVLNSSVINGSESDEALRAAELGYTVNVVDDATWGAMTAADFAAYRLIIVGDRSCSSLPAVVSQNAQALADAVMARAGGNARAGNRVLIGTDPVFHRGGGLTLIDTAVEFAQAQEGASGLYLSFSCNDPDYSPGNGIPDGQEKLLPLLSDATNPVWSQNQNPPCGGAASLISNAAQFSTLRSSDLQGWGCSVHESFPQFPTDWTALAIATDTEEQPTCGTDVDNGEPVCGEAHILIAGSGIVAEAPNLALSPTTATNPVGTSHTVTATVTTNEEEPVEGSLVEFLVTGANANAQGTCNPADCRTNSDGLVTFTYTGTSLGDDTINASMTVNESRQTATAAKTWTMATAPPGGSTDVGVAMSASPGTLAVGEQVSFSAVATNHGPFPAPLTRLNLQLPGNVAFASVSTTHGSCSGGATTECELGTLAVGESATVGVVATGASPGGGTAQATVASAEPDPNVGANNSASAGITVTGPGAGGGGGDLPPPEPGRGNAEPLRGTVLVNGQPVEGPVQLQNGDTVDASEGTLELETVNGNGQFAGGEFRYFDVSGGTLMRRATAGAEELTVTEIRLFGGDFKRTCATTTRRLSAAEARKPRPKKTKVRSLWGNAKGSFRTRGRHSSATVRGTVWFTADRCDGTLTFVREGSVLVDDFVLNRTRIVNAGQRYLALSKASIRASTGGGKSKKTR